MNGVFVGYSMYVSMQLIVEQQKLHRENLCSFHFGHSKCIGACIRYAIKLFVTHSIFLIPTDAAWLNIALVMFLLNCIDGWGINM